MAHHKSSAPVKDVDFLGWVDGIATNCKANQAPDKWNISVGKLDKLNALYTAAKAAFDKNNNPDNRSHLTVVEKNFAIGTLRKYTSRFVDYLEGWESVPDSGLATMKLRPREHTGRRPLPRPAVAPDIKVHSGEHHEVEIFAASTQHGHPTEFLASGNFHGIRVHYHLDGAEPVEYDHTSLHDIIYFADEDVGKRVSVKAAFVNPRMEAGPWSDTAVKIVN